MILTDEIVRDFYNTYMIMVTAIYLLLHTLVM